MKNIYPIVGILPGDQYGFDEIALLNPNNPVYLLSLPKLNQESFFIHEHECSTYKRVIDYLQSCIGDLKTSTLNQQYNIALEQLHLFYKNMAQDKVSDLSILVFDQTLLEKGNADLLLAKLEKELRKRNYPSAIDLNKHVGFIVCPDYINGQLLDKVADLCHKHRTLFITTYRKDIASASEAIMLLQEDDLGGAEMKWSSVVMCVNAIVSDDKEYLSTAAAVAGRIYSAPIEQPAAGVKHGQLIGCKKVVFKILVMEVDEIGQLGGLPLMNIFGVIAAYSESTLYKGSEKFLSLYSYVRTHNWISNCLCHHLNKSIGISTPVDLNLYKGQISLFLEQLTKAKIIQNGIVSMLEYSDDTSKLNFSLNIEYNYMIGPKLFNFTI